MAPSWLGWYHRRPLFWLSLAAMSGILAQVFVQPAWPMALGVATAGVACTFLSRREATWLAGAFLSFAGWTAWWSAPAAPLARYAGSVVVVRGRWEHSPGRRQRVLRVTARWSDGRWIAASDRIGVSPAPEAARGGEAWVLRGRLRLTEGRGGPGLPSERIEWMRRRVRLVLTVRDAALLEAAQQELFQRLLAFRGALLHRFDATLNPETATIARSLLLGDPDPSDPELAREIRTVFRRAGTVHILVVSGTQVTLVLLAFVWLGWRFFRVRGLFWGAGFATLALYVLLVEGEAPIGRAGLMGGVMVLALALRREPDAENSLGGAALVLLALNPFTVFDLGFMLSICAVWGLLRPGAALYWSLAPAASTPSGPWAAYAHGLHRGAAAIVGSVVGAHLAVTPLLAFHFHQTGWSGVLANPPMIWCASRMLYLSLGHLVLTPFGSDLLVGALEYHARELLGAARFFAEGPFGTRPALAPPAWLLPLPYLLLGAAGSGAGPRLRPVLAVLAAAVAVWGLERAPAPAPSVPRLTMLDVGQGESILLESPGGTRVLVDAGPAPGARPPSARQLAALRIAALDALVLTHADADHAGALREVLRSAPPRLVVLGEGAGTPEQQRNAIEYCRRVGIRILVARAGDSLRIGDTLCRIRAAGSPTGRDENADSLVFHWSCGPASALMMGDLPGVLEARLTLGTLGAAVLKVGHHGSAGSTTDTLLDAVRPSLAVISAGRRNPHGHPATQTLARLESRGIPCLRTDRDGMIRVEFRPEGLRAEAWGRKPW